MTQAPDVKERYVAAFKAFATNGAGAAPPWLREIREGAIARFTELGFPTMKQEEWRFTSVAPIAETRFALAQPNLSRTPTPRDIDRFVPRAVGLAPKEHRDRRAGGTRRRRGELRRPGGGRLLDERGDGARGRRGCASGVLPRAARESRRVSRRRDPHAPGARQRARLPPRRTGGRPVPPRRPHRPRRPPRAPHADRPVPPGWRAAPRPPHGARP